MINPIEPHPARSRPRVSWIILGLYGVLALGLTWPVIANLATRLPGTATWAFDESTFAWNIWYFKYALLNLQVSPLHSDLIWYPLGIDLILYTYNFFNAIIALPLLVAFNLPLASNMTILFAAAVSGLGAYLVARYSLYLNSDAPRDMRRITLAAALAGLIYAFGSNRAIYAALGHYDMVTTQWLPFYALYLLKTLREPGRKNAILAGFFFALAALAEMIFASFLALFSVIVLVALWREIRPQWWGALKRLAVVAAVAGVIWAPALIPIAREFVTGDYALTGWGESVKLSADLVGLGTPTDLNPLAARGSWTAALRAVEEGKGCFGDINTVFLGYVTVTLAVLGALVARKRLAAWGGTALVFGVLALGPLLQINGRYRFSLDGLLPEGVTFPLPFALLHFIPFINANRAPNRTSVMLMLGLAVLAAHGAVWLFERIGKWRTANGEWRMANQETRPTFNVSRFASPLIYVSAGVLATLILAEHLAVPLPTTDARIPTIYQKIAAEPDDFAVMQLPLGWRNSFGVLGSEQTNLQYFQTAHGKPLLGSNISRAPAYKMAYFARNPLFKALTDLELYKEVDRQTDAAARATAGPLMALYDVRYLITTPPIPGRYPYMDTAQRTEAYALDLLPLEKPALWEADGYKAYRVIQPALPFPFRVDAGMAGAEPYLGGGWDVRTDERPYDATANWATAKTAELYLPLDGPKAVTLRLAVAPLDYAGAQPQRLSIRINDQLVLRDHPLAAGWQTVEVKVAASATRRGPNRITLAFAWAASPRTVFPDAASRAMIGTTNVVSPLITWRRTDSAKRSSARSMRMAVR